MRLIKRNRLALFLVAIMSIMVFITACTSTAKTTETTKPTDSIKPVESAKAIETAKATETAAPEASNKPAGKVKLKMSTWASNTERKELEAVLKKVNDKSTTYEIELQIIPSDYYTKVQSQIAAKQGPDLMWLSQEFIAKYAQLGALLPLTDALKNVKEFNKDDYYPGAYNIGNYKGDTYFLPWIAQPYVIYLNKDMFAKENVALPTDDWTWDQFIDVGKKFTKDKKYGTVVSMFQLPMLMWSFGGDTFDKNGKIVLDSPESMKGLEMYKKLYNAGISPTRAQAASQGDGEMFKSGKVAMFYGGAGDRPETEPGTFKVGMVLPPKGDFQVTFSGIYGTAVSKTTKYPEIAVQALVDLNKLIVEWKGDSPTKSGYETFTTAHPEKAYAFETIKKAAGISRGFNLIPEEIEMEGAMTSKLTLKIEKGEDIKASIDATIAKWNTIIKK